MTGVSSFRLASVAGRIWYVCVMVDTPCPGPKGVVETERSSTYVRESTHRVLRVQGRPSLSVQLSLTASRPFSLTVPSTVKRPLAISERISAGLAVRSTGTAVVVNLAQVRLG